MAINFAQWIERHLQRRGETFARVALNRTVAKANRASLHRDFAQAAQNVIRPVFQKLDEVLQRHSYRTEITWKVPEDPEARAQAYLQLQCWTPKTSMAEADNPSFTISFVFDRNVVRFNAEPEGRRTPYGYRQYGYLNDPKPMQKALHNVKLSYRALIGGRRHSCVRPIRRKLRISDVTERRVEKLVRDFIQQVLPVRL